MASGEEVYRESQERLHKTLGAFLIVKAWQLKVDCLVLQRKTLLKFLNIERMKIARLNWLKKDLEDYFPYQFTVNYSKSGTYSTLYLSRFEIPNESTKKTMTDEKRIELMKEHGLNCQIYNMPDLNEIVSIMALFSNGLLTPNDFEKISIFDLT